MTQITEYRQPAKRQKSLVLSALAERFMSFVNNAKLAENSKIYLRTGWRLLKHTAIAGMRIDDITSDDIDSLQFLGCPYNANCGLKTLRRMLHKAEEWGLLSKVPKNQVEERIWAHSEIGQRSRTKAPCRILSVTGGGGVERQAAPTYAGRHDHDSRYRDAA
jgi:hypothetical protein